jgi:hypothetical protein
MAISGDYPSPVTVNGFSCRNCTDVDNAKKHIDPAHPSAGPFGINDPNGDKSKIANAAKTHDKAAQKAALTYDRAHGHAYGASASPVQSNAIGVTVDVQG